MERHNGIETDQEGAFVYHADAQATIAALQARVQELEARQHFGACAKCLTNAWRICKEGTPDAVEMKCSNGSTWWLCDYCLSKEQLTQRTAEIEAANKLLYKKNCALGRAETIINDLQAELERVRGERDVWYARYNELSGVKDRQLNDLQAELERVRGERDNALESRDWWRAQLDKERAKLAATSQEG